MRIIGSLIYIIIQSIITPLFAFLIVFSAFIDRDRLPKLLAKNWCRIMLACGVIFRGVKYSISGLENIPKTPCLIMAKHQSEWETLFLPVYLPPHAIVLKQELLKIPFFGWGLKLLDPIAIDRTQKKASLEQVIKQGLERLQKGLYVVIFPEGTRVAPGFRGRYAQSGAQLAIQAQVPIIPVAHNAGAFWPKGFLKSPGVIEVRFGKPIDSTNKTFNELTQEVEEWIENNMTEITGHPANQLRKKQSMALIKKKPREYSIQINDKTIPYKVVRRKNRKTIGLIMGHDGLSVSIPLWVNLNQVEEALYQQQKWIFDKYTTWKNKPKPQTQEWHEGASIPWLGGYKTLKFKSNEQLELFEQDNRYLEIDSTKNDITNQVIEYYRRAIIPIIQEDITYFSQQLGLLSSPRFYISNAQSRWGSCNYKKELRFNWRLMKASREEIRYVVAHEMAHLIEFNHSPQFWQVVEKLDPNYEFAKELLKKNDALYRQF